MIGEKFNCNDGSLCTVVEYLDSRNVKVVFDGFECDGFDGVFVQKSKLIEGNVKNRLRRSVYGVGFIGYGEYSSKKNKSIDPAYSSWKSMIKRCYDIKSNFYGIYGGAGILVSESWHNFQNFAIWFYSQCPKPGVKYNIDKDVYSKIDKVYSEETCIIIPFSANQLFNTQSSRRANLPIGVFEMGSVEKPYRAHLSIMGLLHIIGTYPTVEEAFAAYKAQKERYIKSVASDLYYNGSINGKAFNSMINYEVNIDD